MYFMLVKHVVIRPPALASVHSNNVHIYACALVVAWAAVLHQEQLVLHSRIPVTVTRMSSLTHPTPPTPHPIDYILHVHSAHLPL